ncbi:FUSC family protein [Leucobacter sp. G161]|uniref:FUSC family protein n=1 Tax=Leucobacter sp. G161 TaxID=663704 RepID=UPI00073CADC6|nr:FUSC family protein [Leucobacter sp. G161]KUF08512.1 hypothetical protein AUL38_04455 [Leucobacter sp. G161]
MHEGQKPQNEFAAALRSLFVLAPGPPGPRRWIATRAALSMGIPLAVLTLAGRPDLGLMAGTGAFLALFFAGAAAAERARVLPVIGAVLFACAALGALLAPSPWLTAAGLVVVAIAGSAFSFAYRVGPPGPVFFVLMFGLSGMITSVRDGARVTEPAVFLTTLAGGLLFSYLLALVPLVLAEERARPVRPLREMLPGPWLGAGEQWLVVRIAIVAALGAVLSMLWVDPERAYWTVSTGVAVVGLSTVPNHSFARGLHRTFGTLVGAGAYLLLAPLAQLPWVFVLLLPLLQFTIEFVVVRNYALALVFITPLVLLIAGAAIGDANQLSTATERFVDTAVGSALAMASGVLRERPAKLD